MGIEGNLYRVESHFGAPGWITVLWVRYREMSGCKKLPCDCMWCRMFMQAALAEVDKVEFETKHFKEDK